MKNSESRLSAETSTLSARAEGSRLYLSGIVDERTKVPEWKSIFALLPSNAKAVRLNFDQVDMMNSGGILKWLRFSESISLPIIYEACPTWLVSLFNMVSNFLQRPETAVASLYLPVYFPESESSKAVLVKVEEELPLLADYSNFKTEGLVQTICQKLKVQPTEVELDFETDRYFRFLSQNRERIQRILKENP